MTYTISQAAKKTGISAHTLRYYDKEGILPFIDKNAAGVRIFKDSDFEFLYIINILKSTGMTLKRIKQYIEWCMAGDSMLEKRLEVVRKHKEDIEKQMEDLRKSKEAMDYKIWYYETAIVAKTERIHDNRPFGVYD